jgi:glycerol-3-phosphate acyltransferase PlsY
VLSLPAALALGYLIGSVPVAYLVVRWKSRIDIRQAGSGNVGTLNSFLVTGSKLVGGLVLVLDLLKGFLAVWAAGELFAGGFEPRAASAVGAVLGHNYPVWLSFRGGRGLATAAGVCLALGWPVVPAWLALWGAAYPLLRSVNPANALATLLILVAALALPAEWIGAVAPDGITEFRLFASAVMVIILARHVSPVMEFVNERRMARKL